MALVLRTNGAPLSGALFVKNPRRRRKVRMNRKARRSLKFRTVGGLFAKANRRRRAHKKNMGPVMENRRRRSVKHNRKSSALTKLLRRFKMKKNAGYLLNRRRRHAKRNPGYLLNRRHRRSHKKNGLAINRRRRVSMRRNSAASESDFKFPLIAPVEGLVAKFPILGSPIAKAMGALAFGAAAAGTHVLAMRAIRYMNKGLPGPVRTVTKFVAPVAFSLTGVAANYAIQKLPVLSADVKKNLGLAAIIVGGALDMYRFLRGKNAGFAGVEDYSGDEYGDGQAYDVVGLGDADMGAIGMGAIGMGAIGLGDADVTYADAELADAYFSGPDLDGVEGEAALSGPAAYSATFGNTPKVTRRAAALHSRHAGRPGHRWGWLIHLVGWERFQTIAAMEPNARCKLIEELRKQAIATVQAQSAAKSNMGAIGMGDMDMSGLAMSGVNDYGIIMAGAAY